MLYKCKNCKKEFKSKKLNQKFCCKDCYLEYYRKYHPTKGINVKERIEVVCKECGKHEFVTPGRAKGYVCCSVKCLSKYNAKRYNQKVELICPICSKKYYVKKSHVNKHRTCGDKECSKKGRSMHTAGVKNPKYKTVSEKLRETHIKNGNLHQHVVKEYFGFQRLKDLPKGYHIHHKDCNHDNNNVHNLVMLPGDVHMLVHRHFGNVLLNALHTGKITEDLFFSLCSEKQKNFYKQIINLNITNQVVVKQGELLESPAEDNQQPSVYRNIYVGSETNTRVLTGNTEGSNGNTSALPTSDSSEDIVQTACITFEDAEL